MALQNPTLQVAGPQAAMPGAGRSLLPRSLRWRLMALVTLCLVLSIFGFGTYMAKEQADQAREEAVQKMTAKAQNLAAISAHFLTTDDLAGLESAASKFAATPEVASMLVTDSRGKPVVELVNNNGKWALNFSTAIVPVPPMKQAVLQSALTAVEGETDAAWHPVEVGSLLGWARVSFVQPSFAALVVRIWAQALWVFALACALALWLLSGLLKPPLRALTQATQFANELDQDLGNKLSPYTAVAEFGALGTALNTAADRLHSASQDLNNRQFALDQHAIVSIADLNGDILYVNDRFCQVSGYSRCELLGKNHRIVNSGHHGADVFHGLWQTIGEGKVWQGELQNRRKDGSHYWVESTIVPLPGANGLPAQYISIRTDITAQKLLANYLRISEERIAFAMEGSGDGVWDWDLEHDTVLFSRRWKEMLGYAEDEIGVDITEWSTRVHSEDFPAVMAAVEACQDGKTRSFSTEHRMQCKDGSYLWIRDRGMVVSHDASGMPLRLVASHSDISQLRRALEEAQIANIAKSRFLATMSHEIRTPMNGVLGMAQLMLQPELSEDKRLDYARTILSSGQVLLALLNDILDLSKIEAGKFQLDATESEIAAVLAETSALFTGAAHSKGLQMAHQWYGPPAQHYLCDAHRLRQMLSNLVGNALKFTAQGSVKISATEVEREGETALLEFSVQDSGIGIAADKQHLLFKPFSQADSSTTREFGGSGLGLSIVGRLATAMGGDVGVQSEVGKGSRFWFRVRVQAIAESNTAPLTKAMLALPAGGDVLFSGHLLVAEDNPTNAKLIEIYLRTLGLQMTLAANGQQAVDAIEHGAVLEAATAPDLILMDMQMPVLNGQQATVQIRQWEADHGKPRIPIIALTANAFEYDRKQCLAAGMDDFLTKPLSMDALKSALSRWLPAANTAHLPTARPAAALPVDAQAFAALISELLPLLEKHRFAALGRFKALQVLTAGTALGQDISALAAPMQDMKFALVRERLNHILKNHDEQ